jgi:hypothetical protein
MDYSNIPSAFAYGEYISLRWYYISELMFPIMIALIKGSC